MHIGGFLAGLLAFAGFDPIPVSTGVGPSEGHGRAAPARSILMRLPAALCSQCHGAQPTALGAFAKAVIVALTCVEAIILCRLRKLVCTVSCCGALNAMPPGDAENCGNTNSFICANVNGVTRSL